ncbi:hypothetical protein ABPG74_009222 [Tetrahymena malaccensis]
MNIEENRSQRQDSEQSQLHQSMLEQQRTVIEEPEECNSEESKEQEELVQRRKRYKMKKSCNCLIFGCCELIGLLVVIITIIAYFSFCFEYSQVKLPTSYTNALENSQNLNLKIQITKDGKVLEQYETKKLSYQSGVRVKQNFSLTKQQIFSKPYPQVKIIIMDNDNKMQYSEVGDLIDIKPDFNKMMENLLNVLQEKRIENNNQNGKVLMFRQKLFCQLDYKTKLYEQNDLSNLKKLRIQKLDDNNKIYYPQISFNQIMAKSTDLISEQIAEKNIQKNFRIEVIFYIQNEINNILEEKAELYFSNKSMDIVKDQLGEEQKFISIEFSVLYIIYLAFDALYILLNLNFWCKTEEYHGLSLRQFYIVFFFAIFIFVDKVFYSIDDDNKAYSLVYFFITITIMINSSEFSFSWKFPFLKIDSYEETYVRTTKKYDKEAALYMMKFIIFLFLGSLLYSYFVQHEPLNLQTAIQNIVKVYDNFGNLVTSFPQLYINYKLKSNSYPQRIMLYNLISQTIYGLGQFYYKEYEIVSLINVCCKEVDQIDMCVEHVYAPSTFNKYFYDSQLCIECELGYIVSKNYKSCIEFRFQLSHLQFANCKRLGQDGQCAEALNGIWLLPNNQYTIVQDQKFFERCAIVNESETECLFPRFGFILDIITKNIFKDTLKTFCALFDSKLKQCKEFQQRFTSYFYQQQGFYLGEHFINPNQILLFHDYIFCKNNFIYIEITYHKLVGCIDQQKNLQIDKYMCQQGYALRDDKSKCQVIIPFCQEYFEIQGKELCSKCIPFYKLHLQSCIKMFGCLIISRKNPNICLRCSIKSILINGECIFKNERNLYNQQNPDSKQNRSLKIHQNDSINLIDDIQTRFEVSQNEINKKKQIPFLSQKKHIKNEEDFKNYFGKYFNQSRIQQQSSGQLDQTQNDDQCVRNDKMECIYCIINNTHYVDEQRNNCFLRIRSQFCQHQIYNFDACLSLECLADCAINENLIENFDFKNLKAVNYLVYLSQKFVGLDYFITDSEKEQLNKIYKFFGVDLDKEGQICVNLSDKMKQNEIIYYNYIQKQYLAEENITNRLEFPHLIYSNIDDIHVNPIDKLIEKCKRYNKQNSFCLECEQEFYFNSKTMKCEQNIKNCIIHTKQNTCFLCQSGYYLVQGTHCEAICGISVPGSVNLFHSYYTVQNTTFNSTICKETQVPCKYFLNHRCVECFEGYYLDYSSDYNCFVDSKFPDCKIVDKIKQNNIQLEQENYMYQGKQCIQCQEEYVLFQGLCFCQTKKCIDYIYCDEKKCFNKYRSQFIGQLNLGNNQYLEKHGDYYKVLDCNIENCLLCHEGNICIKCKYGFFPDQNNQACLAGQKEVEIAPIKKIQNCLILSKDEKNCYQCEPNYFLKSDLKCYTKCDPDEQIIFESEIGNYCYNCPIGCKECHFNVYEIEQKQLVCQSCFQNYFHYPEIEQCKKICVFYQSGDQCVKSCKNKFLLGNICVEQCPKFYKVENDQKICIDSCEGQYRYDDNPQKCSTKCEENYLIVKKKQLCMKCQIKNCSKCSIYQQNICIECSEKFFILYGQCFFVCQNGLFVKEEKDCNKDNKIKFCLDQKQGQCIKCIPNSQFSQNHQTACQCNPEYEFAQNLSKCIKICDENCQICDQNQSQCLRCKPDKYLLLHSYQGKNYCIDQCPITYYPSIIAGDINKKACQKCPVNCFTCNNEYSCTECNLGYQEYYCNNKLMCVCDRLDCKDNQFQFKNIQYKCCQVQNCSKCEENNYICQKCNRIKPYLYLNTCLESCPEGTFSKENYECELCHPLCKNCLSQSLKDCLSCILSNHVVESDQTCRCANQKVFFQNRCYTYCPRFTKMIENEDRICQQYCLDNISFPVFDENGVFERCENNFNTQDSKYCEQNLLNLEKYIKFYFQNNQEISQTQSAKIIITVLQTPRECYDFQLRADPTQSDDLLNVHFKDFKIENYFNFQFRMEAQIQISQISQKYGDKCQYRACTLYLLIYSNSLLKKTIKLNIDFKSQIIDIQSLSYANLKYIQSYESKTFEKDKSFLNSLMSVNCENPILYNDKSIVLYSPSSLKFKIQTLFNNSSKIIQNLFLIPIQVFVLEENNNLLKINDFQYNNFYPSQIEIEINFSQELKGNLTLVLRAIEWKHEYLGYEHFVDKNQNEYFIQQNIQIELQDHKQGNDIFEKN